MADLLPGGVLPPGEPTVDVANTASAQPGPIVLGTPDLKPINPTAKLQDPFSGLTEVKPNDPFSGLTEVKSPDAFSHLQQADQLDLKNRAALLADDTFHPGDYLANNPHVTQDPAKLQKLLDVYRDRQKRGLEFTKVAKAAVTEAPGLVGKTLLGARDLTSRVIDLAVQPAANKILGTLTGASPEEQAAIQAEQGKAQLKAAGEIAAGTETAVTGLSQLGQQGVRKLGHVFGKSIDKTDDAELLHQLYLDSEFSKATKEVAAGNGEAVKAAGLDAPTLAKAGVVLDPKAIENLSLVDPLTLVAVGGAFKVVGLGGRVLATAATRVGAQSVINSVGKLAQITTAKLVQGGGIGVQALGKSGEAIGGLVGAAKSGSLAGAFAGAKVGEKVGQVVTNIGGKIAEVGKQLTPGVQGPLTSGMQRLADLASSPAAEIAKSSAKGAVQGAVTAAPLAAASDESQTAGALLGAGVALGGLHGAITGTKTAVGETVAKHYLDPSNIPFDETPSPGYGVDKNLDATHEAAVKTLPQKEQNAINTFREAVRPGGGEIYVQDQASYLQRIRENLQRSTTLASGNLSPLQEAQAQLYANTHAYFDGTLPDGRRVVFLNSDAKGLPHDAGHLFQALLPEDQQAALRKSALESHTPAQLDEFKRRYAARLGEPDYFDKLGQKAGDAKAADELIAENFGQLFQNTPLEDLKSPRSFLQKLGQAAVNASEALGLDLKAGRTTPELGATPSFRLQDLLRNAAQNVLNKTPKAPVSSTNPIKMVAPEAPVKPAASTTPAMTDAELGNLFNIEIAPAKPAGKVTPTDVKPAEQLKLDLNKPTETKQTTPEVTPQVPGTTARNIRVTPEQQRDFAAKRAEETGVAEAQKATENNPEVRAIVDQIAKHIESGNPVLEVEHRGIVSEAGAPNPEGRTSRRGTQESGYAELERLQIENRKNAPADVVNEHQKTFVPVRFVTQGGKPTLIAMSLDKVIANIHKVASDAASKGAGDLLPYPVENGKLTDAGWQQAIADVKAYAENQSNGYRGDGQKLVRPTEDIGVSIPAENPDYTPKPLSEAAMNFANLVQGLNPPETGRVQKGLTPGNVKGQLLAEVNKKQPQTPSVISPEHVQKQGFKGFEPRTVKETNPLRNELAARGVKVRELTEVTERLAAEDIASVKARPELGFKAPVTDVIRAGFLPGESVQDVGKKIIDASSDEWTAINADWRANKSSLTNEAYNLGLGLTDRADVGKLAALRDEASAKFKELIAKKDIDAAYAWASKGQFFSEAYGAATGTGSAPTGMRLTKDTRPFPFPETGEAKFLPGGKETPLDAEIAKRLEDKKKAGVQITDIVRKDTRLAAERDARNGRPEGRTEASALFLPQTEAGKALAEKGYDFELSGIIGNRTLLVYKGNALVGEIKSTQSSATKSEIASSVIMPTERGKGLGEAAYRELLTQLKADGVKTVTGNIVAPQPLAIRRNIFGSENTKVRGGSGAIPVEEALAKFSTPGDHPLFATRNTISADQQFLPKRETEAEANARIAATDYSKYDVAPEEKSATGSLTGWITPAGIHVPIDTAYHQEWLAKNAEKLNAEFGTDFKTASTLNDRLTALNHGFVRIRDTSGVTAVELNQKFFKGKTKSEVENQLFNGLDSIDSLRVNLLDNDGNVTDSTFARFVNSDNAKADLRSALDSLKPSAELPVIKKGPSNIQRMRALGGDFLPGNEEKYTVIWKPRAAGKTTFRNEVTATSPEDAQSKVIPKSGHLVNVFTNQSVNDKAGAVLKDILPALEDRAKNSFLPKDTRETHEEFFKKPATEKPDLSKIPEGQLIDGKDLFGSGWLFTNGQGRVVDAAIHHDQYTNGLADMTHFEGGTPSEAFQAATGSMRVATTSSINAVQDHGNADLGISFSKKPTSSQMSALKGILRGETPDGDPHFDTVNLDFNGANGDVVASQMFRYPQERGAINRFLNNPFAEEFSKHVPSLEIGFVGSKSPTLTGTKEQLAKFIASSKLGPELQKIDPKSISSFDVIEYEAAGANENTRRFGQFKEPDREKLAQALQDRYEDVMKPVFEKKFLPGDQNLPGFSEKGSTDEAQRAVRNRVAESRSFPEAHPLEFKKDENGNFDLVDGKPQRIPREYNLNDTPLAKESAKGLKGPAREEAFTDALADRVVTNYKEVEKNPDIKAGEKWYSTARSRLKKLLGNDTKLFAELLGATSARTEVGVNFNFALEAYNQWKSGNYDSILEKYREGKTNFESGNVADFVKEHGDEPPSRAAYLDWWIDKHNLSPVQSNGKKFGMNSRQVLKVLDGSWASEVKGPKTPNFTGNLTGLTFEATVDVWAARMLHRLSNEGSLKKWRIQPGNETGVTDTDFYTGQKAFRKAADKLGIKPDALQAVLWFAEKDYWTKHGWTATSAIGETKSDFNTLLSQTERTPSGKLRAKTQSQELNLGDVNPRNK